MQGRSSIPLRGTSGCTRHTQIETPPGVDTDRCLECLRAALSHDIVPQDDDIPQLCRSWDNNITDLVSGIPLKLPPIQEVNHEINLLILRNVSTTNCRNAQSISTKSSQKIERYTTAQWWIPAVAHQVVPMLCILKKNGKLRTVFDL